MDSRRILLYGGRDDVNLKRGEGLSGFRRKPGEMEKIFFLW